MLGNGRHEGEGGHRGRQVQYQERPSVASSWAWAGNELSRAVKCFS